MNTVFSGIVVLISRWGASRSKVSRWACCTMWCPPAVDIYQWKLQGIMCTIPCEKGLVESSARAGDVKRVEAKWLSIPWNCQTRRRQYCGWYWQSCSSSTNGTHSPTIRIDPSTQLVLATVLGYAAAVQLETRTETLVEVWDHGSTELGNYGQVNTRTGPNTGGFGQRQSALQFRFAVVSILAAIMLSNSHHIMTWYIRKWFSSTSSLTPWSPICNRINIRWVTME